MIFKCKNCGGNTVYHPDKGAMWCPHCEGIDSEERIDNNSLVTCQNCGAPLEGVTEFTSALKCSHCGTYIILNERVEGQNRAKLILPFKVSKEKAVEALQTEFKKRVLTPDSFLSQKSLEQMEGSYVPFWLYDYVSQIDYEGKATKVRVFRQGDMEVTETSHYRVVRKMDVDFSKVPVDASERMADDIMDLMEPFEYQALQNFEEKYMSGFTGEVVNFPETELEDRAIQKIRKDSEILLQETMAGYTTNVPLRKDIKGLKKQAVFALLPVWVYRYQFRGKDYIYYVNGQTGKVVGQTPTDKGKAFLYSSTVAALVMIICQCINMIMEVL